MFNFCMEVIIYNSAWPLAAVMREASEEEQEVCGYTTEEKERAQ